MKTLLFVFLTFFLVQTSSANLKMDLEVPFLKAIGAHQNVAQSNSFKNWDGSKGFPPIPTQAPIGACQSFEASAMMEYIYYHATGQVIDLSEKYIAYKLLELMIHEFWDKKEKKYKRNPFLGYGDDSFMIEVVSRYGVMPSAFYPWGDLTSTKVNHMHIDVEVFNKYFGRVSRKNYTPEQYMTLLNRAFLSAPPKLFYYKYKYLNFYNNQTVTKIFRYATDFKKFLNIKKDRFHIYFNKDMNSFYFKQTPKNVLKMMQSLQASAAKRNIQNSIVGSKEIISKIVESLDRRMVVGIAADVWIGDWKQPSVLAGGGGHGMVVVGYQKKGQSYYFKLRNSWGNKIGVAGYNYVSSEILAPNIYWIKTYK